MYKLLWNAIVQRSLLVTFIPHLTSCQHAAHRACWRDKTKAISAWASDFDTSSLLNDECCCRPLRKINDVHLVIIILLFEIYRNVHPLAPRYGLEILSWWILLCLYLQLYMWLFFFFSMYCWWFLYFSCYFTFSYWGYFFFMFSFMFVHIYLLFMKVLFYWPPKAEEIDMGEVKRKFTGKGTNTEIHNVIEDGLQWRCFMHLNIGGRCNSKRKEEWYW